MTSLPKPNCSPLPWSYLYNPYLVNCGRDGPETELAAFVVFDIEGNRVFNTNEDMTRERQEADAALAVAASEMAVLLRGFVESDAMASECGEWKWEHLDPLFERARELLGSLGL